jgi:hypothetical protein
MRLWHECSDQEIVNSDGNSQNIADLPATISSLVSTLIPAFLKEQ